MVSRAVPRALVATGVMMLLALTFQPACTTTAPADAEEGGTARGLFMCTCGDTFLIIETDEGEIKIVNVSERNPMPRWEDGEKHL